MLNELLFGVFHILCFFGLVVFILRAARLQTLSVLSLRRFVLSKPQRQKERVKQWREENGKFKTSDDRIITRDSPKSLEFGLVKYLPEEGKSILNKMRLSNIRFANEAMKGKFTESRKILLQREESRKLFSQEIMEEISKIN